MSYNTITVDGRQVLLTTDPGNGFVTSITFPDIHLDNTNPSDALVITISPPMTVEAVESQIVGPILAANPAA